MISSLVLQYTPREKGFPFRYNKISNSALSDITILMTKFFNSLSHYSVTWTITNGSSKSISSTSQLFLSEIISYSLR